MDNELYVDKYQRIITLMGKFKVRSSNMSTRKKIFLILLLVIQLSIIWPGFALFDDIYPLVLGLPLSFAWIIGMLLSAFFLLLWYYLSDPKHKQQSQPETDHR